MNMQNSKKSREDFLDKKRDYSPFLVHLTRDSEELSTDGNTFIMPAREVLDKILFDHTLHACNHFCLFERFGPNSIESSNESVGNKFKVVCLTETPIDQIEVLLEKQEWKTKKFEPYGLVFKKEYIKEKGGNHVFYVSPHLFATMWQIYNTALAANFAQEENRFLALVNKCDGDFDFHWEREWRKVGDLEFELINVYCGLCPEEEIEDFKSKYSTIPFISPKWGINKILDEMVKNSKHPLQDLPF